MENGKNKINPKQKNSQIENDQKLMRTDYIDMVVSHCAAQLYVTIMANLT